MGAQYDELRMELNTMLTSNRRVANQITLPPPGGYRVAIPWLCLVLGTRRDDGLGGAGYPLGGAGKEDGQNEASRLFHCPMTSVAQLRGKLYVFPGFNGSPALSVSASMRLRAMDNAGNAGEWSDWRG